MGWLEKVSREGNKKNCGKEFHANVLGERFPNEGFISGQCSRSSRIMQRPSQLGWSEEVYFKLISIYALTQSNTILLFQVCDDGLQISIGTPKIWS